MQATERLELPSSNGHHAHIIYLLPGLRNFYIRVHYYFATTAITF